MKLQTIGILPDIIAIIVSHASDPFFLPVVARIAVPWSPEGCFVIAGIPLITRHPITCNRFDMQIKKQDIATAGTIQQRSIGSCSIAGSAGRIVVWKSRPVRFRVGNDGIPEGRFCNITAAGWTEDISDFSGFTALHGYHRQLALESHGMNISVLPGKIPRRAGKMGIAGYGCRLVKSAQRG